MRVRLAAAFTTAMAILGLYPAPVLPAPAGTSADATRATARAAVLDRMATLLEQRYLDVELGRQLAAMVRDAAASGRFDDAVEPQAFAGAVTQALRATVPDLHLAVTFEPDREFVPGAGAGQRVVRQDAAGPRMVMRTGRLDGRGEEEVARTNFGLDRVERMAGNIGYLRLSRFVPADLSRETMRAAIGFLAHADAVVIDLRANIGGAPDAVAELMSPFIAADRGAVELHVAENRALGVRDAVATDPARAHAKLATVPMYILTSPQTASAAEMFAYAAHRVGRATLVGEGTAGAGNGGAKHSVGEGYALVVPEWRSRTGSWERTGVKPDIEVPADAALERALQLARERIGAT